MILIVGFQLEFVEQLTDILLSTSRRQADGRLSSDPIDDVLLGHPLAAEIEPIRSLFVIERTFHVDRQCSSADSIWTKQARDRRRRVSLGISRHSTYLWLRARALSDVLLSVECDRPHRDRIFLRRLQRHRPVRVGAPLNELLSMIPTNYLKGKHSQTCHVFKTKRAAP
jgi:hypothetical protein